MQKMQIKAVEGVRDLKLGIKLFNKNIYIYEKNAAPFLRGANIFQCDMIKFIANWC